MNVDRTAETVEVYVPQSVVSHTGASMVMSAALAKAEQLGVKVNVAVVDSGGNLTGFLRMPGSFLLSIEMACNKARCAAGLGLAPEIVEQIVDSEHPRVREGLLSLRGVSFIQGGLPLMVDGMLIGGIGVSGGSEGQDVLCARAGAAAMAAMSKTTIHDCKAT